MNDAPMNPGVVTGFINLNKPNALTSFDCIRRLRKLIGTRKMGHLGTLDPSATGVLPVATGRATRLIPYLEGGGKIYRAVFLLGMVTDTDDCQGTVKSTAPVEHITADEVFKHLQTFTGDIIQTPPTVSAVKVDGVRAYQLARQGRNPRPKPRKVRIDRIELITADLPRLEIRLETGPGVYVRSVARDLGEVLGCGGTVEQIIRERSGGFLLKDSITLEQVEEFCRKDEAEKILIPPEKVLQGFSRVTVSPRGMELVRNGRPLGKEMLILKHCDIDWTRDDPVMILDPAGRLIAVGRPRPDMRIHLEKVLTQVNTMK